MNVIQLIFLSWIIGIAAGTLARMAGSGWAVTILVTWLCTVAATFGITATIYFFETLRARRNSDRDDESSRNLDTLVEEWDKDLVLERAEVRTTLAGARGVAIRRTPVKRR